jgi:hypothetical protein
MVAVIVLRPGFASGRVLTRLSDTDFSVPTTIDDLGKRLYAVTARFRRCLQSRWRGWANAREGGAAGGPSRRRAASIKSGVVKPSVNVA